MIRRLIPLALSFLLILGGSTLLAHDTGSAGASDSTGGCRPADCKPEKCSKSSRCDRADCKTCDGKPCGRKAEEGEEAA